MLQLKFGNTCSEKCAKALARRGARAAEKAALAALEAAALLKKESAEVEEWANRLREAYKAMGRVFAPLPGTSKEARAVLLQRERFVEQQKGWDAARARRLGRR